METPKEVIELAGDLVEEYGDKFRHLGQKDGYEVFQFVFPDDEKTGYPIIYAFKEGDTVLEITGMDALDIIVSLIE